MKPFPLAVLAAAVALGGCSDTSQPDAATAPSFLVGPVAQTHYDGLNDDLLTAGLGRAGLQSAFAPALSTPPSPAELRRLAIWNNYRALLDATPAGGYGTLYGPNVAPDGTVTTNPGLVAGTEFIAYTDDGVTLMVQVPDGFTAAHACIVSATSSGSRGVYGAMATAEWGLKRGCAVAFTDKGTGAAPHDLQADTVPLIDGTRATQAAVAASGAASAAQFSAGLNAAELAAFDAASPNRFAFKHAHSGRNPEKDWGRWTLQAIQFAFYAANQVVGRVLFDGSHERVVTPGTTLVIASSASNGGGAALAAAEQDTDGLIDGVAVAEPMIEMPDAAGVTVRRGSTAYAVAGKPLLDYTSVANLYESCASQAASVAGAPGLALVPAALAANRCAGLHAKGLLASTTPAAQADEALQKLRDYGWEPESGDLYASLAGLEVAPAIAVTYANAAARARVSDRLCGFSFAATDANGAVIPLDATLLANMFGTGNGVPPSSGVQLVNDLDPNGPRRASLSTSASTGLPDFDLDGAACLRALVTGTGPQAAAVAQGLGEVRLTGRLDGRPALIVHGRSDGLVPVNHSSRPYAALAHLVDGAASQLSYIEVTNAQHFDSFIGATTLLAGYDTRYVPLHLYLLRALDAMYDHLRNGTPLPPSQVVRTVPRGGAAGLAPAIAASNVPAIASAPAAGDAISYTGATINVPD